MKFLATALAAPLLLIGAAYPETSQPDDPSQLPAEAVPATPITYQPCRPGPGDDRCIQLYERGVRASYAGWLRRHGVEAAPVQVAMGGPDEAGAPRSRAHRQRHERAPGPARHRHARDARCIEPPVQEGEARGM